MGLQTGSALKFVVNHLHFDDQLSLASSQRESFYMDDEEQIRLAYWYSECFRSACILAVRVENGLQIAAFTTEASI